MTGIRAADVRADLTRLTLFTIARAVARLTRAAARAYRIHRDMRRLQELSDDQLKDIGLGRSQIENAARYGRPF